MQLESISVITRYEDETAGRILEAMEETLTEVTLELFDRPAAGIIARVDYRRLEDLYYNGKHWRKLEFFELGLARENIFYNLFSLSERLRARKFVYLEVYRNEEEFYYEGCTMTDAEIRLRLDEPRPDGLQILMTELFPDCRDESFHLFFQPPRNGKTVADTSDFINSGN